MNTTTNRFFHLATVILWILGALYFVDCLFHTIENLSLLGATMIFKPAFPSIIDMVRDERRYGESDRMRNYAGLHTPASECLTMLLKHC